MSLSWFYFDSYRLGRGEGLGRKQTPLSSEWGDCVANERKQPAFFSVLWMVILPVFM